MLSRTADHLFWMSRYMERAENTARMLDVNYQTALLPQSADAAEAGWRGLLSISELSEHFEAHHGGVTAQRVMDYMVFDAENDSSIHNCLLAARENARAVRGTLTTEVWETQNRPGSNSSACPGPAASSAIRVRCSSGSSSARTCRAA